MPRHPNSQTPEKATAATRPATPPTEERWNVVMARLLREVCYQPDGKPPEGWTIGQDLAICKRALKTGWANAANLEASIRGLRVIYPTGKLTLKLLVADRDGSLWRRSATAHWDAGKRKPAAKQLKDILREMIA